MKWISRFFIVSLLFTLTFVRAAGDPDSAYIDILRKINEGDALLQTADTNSAFAKYAEAQKALLAFDKNYRHWNDVIVPYRLNYLSEKLISLRGAVEVTPAAKPLAAKASALKATADPVTILSVGVEPRQVLRLHPAAGDKQTLTMTIKMAMETQAAGVPTQPMKMPVIVTPMEITVQNVADNGDITYQSTTGEPAILDEPGAMPGIAEVMKNSVSGMKGMTTTGTVSSRGLGKGVEMNLPAGMAPQMRDSIEQMKDAMDKASTPFPEQAVGPGAKWEYKTRVKSQGMTIDQTMTSELVSINGDVITLRNTITQNAANQTVENPSMPGIKVELTKMSGTSSGTATRRLTQLMPLAGSLSGNMEMAMAVPIGQQKQQMSMNMNMDITFESK